MHFSVPAGPCFCFSVLVEIRQNIFRLCGQSIGTGGGQLCFAPEAPENAQSGQTGIVSRKDVYVAVAHEKGALRVCAEVSHQRVDASRVGFGGNTGAAASHQRKAVRAEVVLDDLSTKSVRFGWKKNGGLDALDLQRGQQFQDAGIGAVLSSLWASYRAENSASVAASCSGVLAFSGEKRSTSFGMPLPTKCL